MKHMKKIIILLVCTLIAFTAAACSVESGNGCDCTDGSDGGSEVIMTNNDGFINILDAGAKADMPSYDSYPAFAAAVLSGKSIYVPAGTYYVSHTITLRNQNMFGDGMYQSYIYSTDTSEGAAVVSLARTCSVRDLTIGFAQGIVTGDETEGQRVGILTGDGEYSLQRGSEIKCVNIDGTGTAIYGPSKDGYESFSVTYDTLEIQNFSFRGIDFQSSIRTGNSYRNIYMMSSKYTVDCLFNLAGEESECTIEQLNVEHTRVSRAAVSLVGCRALDLASLHIEGIMLTGIGADFIYLSETSGRIGALSVYYTGIDAKNCSLIEINSNCYNVYSFSYETLTKLKIETLHLKGLNDTNVPLHGQRYGMNDGAVSGFTFIKRTASATGNFTVTIENYTYFTFQTDSAVYEAFASSGAVVVNK